MEQRYAPSKISYDELQSKAQYGSGSSYVSKEVKPFEEMRINTILETLELRKAEGNAFLEKTEFLVLIEWRAHRAKVYSFAAFQSAAKNSVTKIREITKKAFAEYESNKMNTNNPIKILRELEGVPLQTATLILSAYDPVNLPYFSDELDRYLRWGDAKAGDRHEDTAISYSMKEYSLLHAKVNEMRARIKEESGKDIRALDIEMSARFMCTFAMSHIKFHRKGTNDIALVPEEKSRKKRKTQSEIWQEEHPRGSEKDPFRAIHITVDKGRDGSPTYDEFGFQMDYDKCVEWEKPATRTMMRPTMAGTNRMLAKFKQQDEDFKSMAELMDDKENLASLRDHPGRSMEKENAYKERVRNDLGLKTYHVTLQDVQRWHKQGFRAEKGEFDLEKWDEEKIKRYRDMSTGSALRK